MQLPNLSVPNTPYAFSPKLNRWKISMLVVVMNLAGELSYKFQRWNCLDREYTDGCVSDVLESLSVFMFLTVTIFTWHTADVITISEFKRKILSIITSYRLFGSLLFALIAALWVYRASTTISLDGAYETPAPVFRATVGLVIFLPGLAVTKIAAALFRAIKFIYATLGNKRSGSNR